MTEHCDSKNSRQLLWFPEYRFDVKSAKFIKLINIERIIQTNFPIEILSSDNTKCARVSFSKFSTNV